MISLSIDTTYTTLTFGMENRVHPPIIHVPPTIITTTCTHYYHHNRRLLLLNALIL